MSADNGIYILETLKDSKEGVGFEGYAGNREYEYRVKELQCIENLNYNKDAPNPECPHPSDVYISVNSFRPKDKKHVAWQEQYKNKYNSHDPDVMIVNARHMWTNARVFTTEEEAFMHAAKLERDALHIHGYHMEYGIQQIKIERVF